MVNLRESGIFEISPFSVPGLAEKNMNEVNTVDELLPLSSQQIPLSMPLSIDSDGSLY